MFERDRTSMKWPWAGHTSKNFLDYSSESGRLKGVQVQYKKRGQAKSGLRRQAPRLPEKDIGWVTSWTPRVAAGTGSAVEKDKQVKVEGGGRPFAALEETVRHLDKTPASMQNPARVSVKKSLGAYDRSASQLIGKVAIWARPPATSIR